MTWTIVVVQSLNCVWLFVIPRPAAHQASLSFTTSQSFLKHISIESVMLFNHLIFLPPAPALNLSHHHSLFQWFGSSNQVVKGLELQLQHQSFQWIFRIDFLEDWLVWSPCCPRDSQESSPSPQFESINSVVLSLLCGPTLTSVQDYWKNHNWLYGSLLAKWYLCFLIHCLGLS